MHLGKNKWHLKKNSIFINYFTCRGTCWWKIMQIKQKSNFFFHSKVVSFPTLPVYFLKFWGFFIFFFWQMDPFAPLCEGEGNLRVFSLRPHINSSLLERFWPGKKADKGHVSLLDKWVGFGKQSPEILKGAWKEP